MDFFNGSDWIDVGLALVSLTTSILITILVVKEVRRVRKEKEEQRRIDDDLKPWI